MSKILHFIGIWGIWMSALARYYLNKWYIIKWSDSENSELIWELSLQWINIKLWHNKENITWKESCIFFSSAINANNPELEKSRELNLKCLNYFEWLWEISHNTKSIAISWTHWKSTTTAMIWIILQEIWIKPDVIVWTKVPNFNNKNYLAGNWEYLIVEACEYKESFLNIKVFWAIILNIEADHLDYYKNEDNYIKWFESFVKNISPNWFLVINKDDANSNKVKQKAKCEIIEIESSIEILELMPTLPVPWDHIKLDWLFALATCNKILNNDKVFDLKVLDDKILDALKMFKWTWRRFEQVWKLNWAHIISDYAHHPTEIKLTLQWSREKYWNNKIICIFEPHQYSRTIELFDEFCKSFSNCDLVIIPSIYEVRDNPNDIKKMSAEKLCKWINKISNNSLFIDWYSKTQSYLANNVKLWDVVIIMGAWPIDELAKKLTCK